MAAKRRTAAEIIAFYRCDDIREIQDCRYQPTRYASPAIYSIGEGYYAAPADNRPPRAEVGQPWECVGTFYNRKVYFSRMAGSK
jgi:hypothetical protein